VFVTKNHLRRSARGPCPPLVVFVSRNLGVPLEEYKAQRQKAKGKRQKLKARGGGIRMRGELH
jgi:hypothetical protein